MSDRQQKFSGLPDRIFSSGRDACECGKAPKQQLSRLWLFCAEG